MPDSVHPFLLIGVVALVTALLRFLPFLVFNGRRPVPKVIQYLGTVLPYSVMAMLVVYCMKGISFSAFSGWLAPAISVSVVVLLHIRKRNTLLSIIGGTVCYMLLIRLIA